LADLYVNDAFSVCHRLHASVVGITKFLPSYAGLLLIKEVNSLDQVLNYPAHPLVILMGGAKINTKLNILTRFLSVADHILLAGGLANNFFLARGAQIGRSIKQTELLSSTKKLLNQPNIILPIDCRIGNLTVKNKLVKTVHLNSKKQKICSSTEAILDVGPATRQLFAKYIKKAKMIIWNGPLGLFEDKRYAQGTKKVWQIIAKQSKAKIIIGGGDTLACLPKRISQKNIFLSLGGGAMLKFLAGQSMPGLTPLIKNIK
ncbi:MAG: phosphoglycerate kinase, partial [Candidatus Aenigmarchaeota archaeon]|nr:phosphoglycerate kinase [Candidatus Aenigmarchaeota archaeon]